MFVYLEALAVDDCRARLVVLLLGDPHLLEGGQGGKDGPADPHRVLTLGRGDDLDLHGGRSKRSHLLLHTLGDAGVHGGTARQHDVAVQVLADIHIALHDGVVAGLVDTSSLHAKEGRLEQGLGAAETLVPDGDDLPVRKLVALLQSGGCGCNLHLLLKVKGDVAELLLDVTHDLTLGSGGERVATLGQDLHEVVGEVTPGKVETKDGVGERIALVDGHGVGHTITSVEHDAGGAARGVQGQHGLDGDVHGGGVEGLEHDLGHLLAVGLGG